MQKSLLLIALGGNALIQKGQRGTAEEQFDNLKVPMRQIARLSRDHRIVITHGNGPQVGNLMLQQESCREVPDMPLEIIVAMTQGQIGYMIESTLDRALMEIGVIDEQLFVSLISYVVVDENDPAFRNPTKPIGPFYTAEQAQALPYAMVETDKGFRRVVASPAPLAIVEHREIKKLIETGFIVICCGGGGIPVIRKERKFRGVDAVIDKDLASSVLAAEIGADIFIIASDVSGVCIDWGKPRQRQLGKVPLAEVERYVAEGHFPAGSMGPKVEAITRFSRKTGHRGIICSLEEIERAVAGEAGTEVV
ncbi:MAG: carbamate kinase [Desulfobacterales bacterium]|jgi:carbamate kinase|nr:carbamate kinase [Desulfobacterales bacterium]